MNRALNEVQDAEVEVVAARPFRRGSPRVVLSLECIVFALTLWSSIFQFYVIPIGEFFLPLALVGAFALFPLEVRLLLSAPVRPILCLYGLIACYTLSLAWSQDPLLGLRTIVYTLPFVSVFYGAYFMRIRYPSQFRKIIRFFVLLACIQAFLVIVFRVSPSIKDGLWNSALATPFLGENAQESMDYEKVMNVTDPDKSGGFILNANVAAAYLGILTLVAYSLSANSESLLLKGALGLLGISIFFTGSKAGILLGGLCFAGGYFTEGFMKRSKMTLLVLVLGFAAMVALLFIYVPEWQSHTRLSGFFSDTDTTTRSRGSIWEFAGSEFLKRPIKGLGFGGWEDAFYYPSIALQFRAALPPHNTFIQLWAQSGIVAPVIYAAFAWFVIKFCLRCVNYGDPALRIEAICCLGAFMWVFLHGMGENFGPFGDAHMLPALAAILGGLYGSMVKLGGRVT